MPQFWRNMKTIFRYILNLCSTHFSDNQHRVSGDDRTHLFLKAEYKKTRYCQNSGFPLLSKPITTTTMLDARKEILYIISAPLLSRWSAFNTFDNGLQDSQWSSLDKKVQKLYFLFQLHFCTLGFFYTFFQIENV